jgi:hypothetical protein
MPEFVIRYAAPDEGELIADLSRKTFYETFGHVNTKENIEKFMKNNLTVKN